MLTIMTRNITDKTQHQAHGRRFAALFDFMFCPF